MADRSSEHLIRIIVQGVNRLGDVVDKGTKAVEKHTGAIERQTQAMNKGGRSSKDAQRDYESFTKAVRDGEKDYESATFGLKQLAGEMDKLAKKEPIGSRMSEDLHRSAQAARALTDQLRLAHEAERKIADTNDKDRIRREQERQKSLADRPIAEPRVILGRGVPIRPSTLRERASALLRRATTGGLSDDLRDVDGSSRGATTSLSRLERTINRLSGSSDHAGFSIARVDNNLRGLMIVGFVAFSQQIISAFVAIATAALAVASAAAQAGAAVGGAFVAAAGQAIPTIGLLIAAFGRMGAVFDAVKLFNDQATKSGYDQAQAADAQAGAADRVTSAQEQAAAASRRVQDATDALTEARERALQKIQDLNLAERDASRSQFEAGQAISRAVATGDVGALEGLRIDRDRASLQAGRTRSEASSAREAGVDRSPEVLQAARNLEEANVALERARREMEAAGRAATRAATAGSAADRALEQALAELTPAEIALYESIKRMQARFRRLFRPVTDVIVGAFKDGIDRATEVMGDARVLGTVTKMAQSIAGSIRRINREASSDRSLNFFKAMGEESSRNIPLLTTLAIKVNRIMEVIALAGGPALRRFIGFFIDLADKGEKATNSSSGLSRLERFFLRGEVMAESFLKLGGAIIGLFAAVAGAGGAETGKDLVDDLTKSIQNATRWVQDNRDKVRGFFKDTAETVRVIAVALFDVARAIVGVFSSERVVAFAEVFSKVLLPALVNVSIALGTITFLLSKFLSLPYVSDLAQFALSMGLLFKAFSVFSRILIPFAAGLARVLGGIKIIGPLFLRAAGMIRVAAAIATGPWGILIAAVITGVVLLDKKFHFIRPTIRFLGDLFERVFGAIKDVVSDVVPPVARFLGVVLVGAFGVVRDVVVKFIDVWVGLQTMLLGGLSTLVSVGSHLPFVGDKFKGLAKFIDAAREKIDGYRESLRDLGKEHDKAPGKIERLRVQVDKLRSRLSHLKEGTDEYRTTAERLRRKQGQLNEAMEDADKKGKKGARGPRAIGVSASSAARAVDRANASIAKGFNKLAEQLGGVKRIVYTAGGTTTTFGGGESVKTDTGDILARATGGWIARKGGPQGPDNRLIRVGEGEAVLAVPHQPLVDRALSFTSRFMGGPGSLDEMFSRVKGYVGAFATGGRVNFGGHPSNVNSSVRRLISLMQGKFPLSVTSTTDHSLMTTSGNLSDHPAGNAVDLSGSTSVMFRAAEYVKRSGLYRRLKQGIHNPNLAVNRGVLQDPPGQFAGSVWDQHADHLHLAVVGALGKLAGGSVADRIKAPRIAGPEGRLKSLIERSTSKLTRAANRRLSEAASIDDAPGFGGNLSGFSGGGDVAANIALGRRMAAATGWVGTQWRALRELWMGESGWRANADNPTSSAYGIPQALPGSKMASAGKDWLTNAATQIRWGIGYIKQRYRDPVSALSSWRGRNPHWYEDGGPVGGQGPKAAVLHGGEHVWTMAEVMRAGGHRVMYALRRMLGGGGQGRSGSYASGGRTSASADRSDGYRTPTVFDTSLDGVLRELSRARTAIGRLRTRSARFVKDFGRSIEQITSDGGLLDQGSAALERLTTGIARRLKLLTYRVTGSGLVRRRLSPGEQALAQLGGIDQQISGLRGLQRATSSSLSDVDRRIQVLRRGGVSAKERKAYQTLVAARRSLIARLSDLDGQLADAIEARFQAQEQVIQSAIEGIGTAASRRLARADLADRVASLVEGVVGGNLTAFSLKGAALLSRGQTLRGQRDALTPLLARAQAQGSTEIAADLIAQIEELNVAIAENSFAVAQNTVAYRTAEVDSINRVASRRLASADLADRTAALIEASGNAPAAFDLRRWALLSRRSTITEQRGALSAQLASAQATFGGTTAEQQQIIELTDQITELTVQLDENSAALASNTVATRQAAIDAITGRGGFLGTVFGGLTGIVRSLGQLAGGEDIERLRQLAQSAGAALQQTGSGLRDQLLQGFGVDLRGLSPEALVDALRSLNFDSIESVMSVEQRQQFEALVAAIIDNASAVVDNTQQLTDLNGTKQQSFSTTAWQLFREAIFNGSGGLLSQYRFGSTMPQPITSSTGAGALGAFAPRMTSGSTTSVGGDTINVNVTNPGPTVDPQWIGEVIATKRPLARATR